MARLARWGRALFFSTLVALTTLATVPRFGTATAERLERPFEQAELGRWQALARTFGLELSREQLGVLYLQLATRVAEARGWVLAPLSWWIQLTQTEPGWTLFGTPDTFSPAFRLQAWDARGERVLYQSGDAEHSWQGSLLGYRRLRAAYNPSRSGYPSSYPGLCQRLSERVFAEQPEVAGVRCAIVRRAVPLPGEQPQREPAEEHVIELTRPPR